MRKQTPSRRERGQALVLLALAFIGLAAFIGLTVDAGILFINVGHLRRAVDAASLAAASQFREGREPPELERAAQEFVRLNGLDDTTVIVRVCDITGAWSGYNDPALCPPAGDPPRKVVQVTATSIVNFAFLPILGWDSTPISANAISEAASVDLVLTIDVSPSMGYDLCKDGIDNDGDGVMDAQDCDDYYGGPPWYNGGPNGHDESWIGDPLDSSKGGCRWATDIANKCHPFEEVRSAAKELVKRTNFPYDRIALVTFGRLPTEILELSSCQAAPDPKACVTAGLDSMEVEWPPEPSSSYCPGWRPDPRGCMPTNIADGLTMAGNEFGPLVVGDPPRGRQEAVWIVVLLTDGAANAAVTDWGPPIVWTCPQSTWDPPTGGGPPYCQDGNGDAGTRHAVGDTEYDADDQARDAADFVGCPDANHDWAAAGCAQDGQNAVIFTIGLGTAVTEYVKGGQPDAGEKLLRYVASVGDDGSRLTDPCQGPPVYPVGTQCGNYYFSPSGAELQKVFEAIASRIFTRINH